MTVFVAQEQTPAPALGLSPDTTSMELARTSGSDGLTGRPGGLAVASDGSLFVSDSASGTIWRVTSSGGTAPVPAPIDGAAGGQERRMSTPAGLALAADGTLFVADTTGHRVWALSPAGDLRVVAGSVYGYRDGPGTEALFRYPSDVAVGPDGTCYVADSGNHRIRTISPDGAVATLAGSIYDYGDGRGPDGRFRQALALDVGPDGTCYVADTGNNAIRRVTPDGEVTTLAGSPPGGDSDGAGDAVGLRWPTGLALDPDGDLFVADHGNGALRRIDPDGASTTLLRLSGRRWPVAVAVAPGDGVVMAVAALDDVRRPRVYLFSVEDGR